MAWIYLATGQLPWPTAPLPSVDASISSLSLGHNLDQSPKKAISSLKGFPFYGSRKRYTSQAEHAQNCSLSRCLKALSTSRSSTWPPISACITLAPQPAPSGKVTSRAPENQELGPLNSTALWPTCPGAREVKLGNSLLHCDRIKPQSCFYGALGGGSSFGGS